MSTIDDVIASISKVNGVTCEGRLYDTSTVTPPLEAWKTVASLDSKPFGFIGVDSERTELIKWFSRILQAEKMTSPAYISVGGYGGLPWIKIQLLTGFDALADYWLSTDSHELLVLNAAMNCVLGITEEEYEFEIYKIGL